MLRGLGNLIEKHPWLIVTSILIITLGFAILLPGLEIKTDFMDFMPDDETVKANWKIIDIFGQSQIMMFLYLQNQKSESILTPQALREQQFIEKELLKMKEVDKSLSIITILDQICFLEFGKVMENCTNEQIKIAAYDIFTDDFPKEIKIFDSDDKNEKIDYNRFPKLSKGKSIDELDIKNCYASYDNESYTFIIEVYDISKFNKELISPIPGSNVLEWFIDFKNMVKPDPRLDIDYRIAAHIEPKHPLWVIGNGLIKNIYYIINQVKNKELFNCYKKEAYLWIKPLGQSMYLPLKLNTAEINFNTNKDQIEIKVSREELGNYGIVPRYGFFELPAKLTNFKAGSRYYQTSIFKLPWFRITVNTSYILNLLKKIKNRPILGNIAEKLLKKYGNITWEDFDELYQQIDEYISIPDQIALKDIENSWVSSDIVPDSGQSEKILFIQTPLYNEVKISTLAFLSKDYEKNKKPTAGLVLLNLNISMDYQNSIKQTEYILEKIKEIDDVNDYISVEVTGDTVISVQMNEITNDANQIMIPMIIIIIILLLLFFFRRTSYIVLALSALSVSTIWIFGTMILLGIPFSMISVAIVPLIMGLGVDYTTHLSHNYRSELSLGRTPAEAMKKSVLEIGTAMFLAMITTVIAFMSFLTASVPPMRYFGLLLALGIFYTFFIAITLQASLRYLIDRKKTKFDKIKKRTQKLKTIMGKLAEVVLTHQKKILGALIFVTIIAALGATQIETGFNFESFLPLESPAIVVYQNIEENFPYAGQDQEYILLEGQVATVDCLNGIKETHENLKDDTFVGRNADGSVKVDSIYNIIVQAVENNVSLIEDFNIDENTKIPKTNQDVKKLFDYLLNTEEYGTQTRLIIHKTSSGRYDAAIIRIYVDIVSAGKQGSDLEKNLKIMIDEFNEDIGYYGDVKAIVTGSFVITHKITSSMSESQIISTAISISLSGIILIIIYKRLTLGLITMLPVLISIVWILGTMYFIEYSLNVLTITVSSLTIGVGIDYSIYVTERFKLVADKTGDIKVALTETISKTGGALIIAALTTAFGFGVLIFAPIPPEQQFGVIMVLTITYSLITSLLMLPLVLARWAKWSKKKKGYIISSKPTDKDFINDIESGKKKG